MADTFPFSHVQQYVLINADEKAKAFKAAKQGKNGKYPTKSHTWTDKNGNTHTSDYQQGRDFYEVKDGNGDRSQFGYKSGFNVDDDGAPTGDGFHQSTTSATWADDNSYLNGKDVNYVVLPANSTGPGGAFEGAKMGDYVTLTNPQNGTQIGAVVGDGGNYGQAGEMSVHAAGDLGIDTKNGTTGMDMTNDQYVQWDWYPGSGKAKGTKIQRQTNDEITKNAKAVAAARSVKGGVVIVSGKNSVLISKQLMPAACADPAVMHLGGCPMATGSDSVSVELCPATRVGDSCSCKKQVVSGEDTVQVGGACTAAKDTPPSKNLYTPPSLSQLPQTGSQTVPSWAQGQSLLGPQQAQPSMMDLANQHFEPTATPAWPDP